MTRRRGLREGRSQSKIETDEGVQAVSFKRSEEKINVKWEDVEKGITGSEKNSREKKKVFGLDQVGSAVFGVVFSGFSPADRTVVGITARNYHYRSLDPGPALRWILCARIPLGYCDPGIRPITVTINCGFCFGFPCTFYVYHL